MEGIYGLIQCLSSREWESLQQFLTCFSTHANDEGGPKQLQLAKILRSDTECPSEKRCCLKVYGVKAHLRFEMLKSRLKDKVLDFLLTDISSDKKRELDEADFAIIKMKKKSAQFQHLFYSKKRTPLLFGLLEDIITLAKEYEQYSLLVDHLRLKKAMISWKRGKKYFEKANEEMEKYWEYNFMVNKAEHYYYELMLFGEYSNNSSHEAMSEFFEKADAELKIFYDKTSSPLIKYHHKFLELGFYWHHKNYSQAQSICAELLGVVRTNKSVYRRQRVGIVYDHLSRCKYYLGNFEEAVECAKEAQIHFNPGSENFCIALEQEFYALFAMKKYTESIVVANKMMASATRKELGESRFSKYNYLLANALFKQAKYKEASQLLSQERGLSKDKTGWEIGARVLTIMTHVETLKLNEASSSIESLRKFIAYTNKKTPVSLRDKTILELLIGAERKGFMFSQLNSKTQDHISSLSSASETLRWEPFTHELIPFHEWFAEKMKGKISIPATVKKSPIKEKVAHS